MQTAQASIAPFPTQNVALAITLHICGVPWYHNERGQAMGVLNDYTPETLREIDARLAREKQPPAHLSRLSHEAGVLAAFRRGLCGEVTYQFQPGELLKRVAAGFDAQSKLIAESDARQSSQDEPVGGALEVSPEVAAAICCQYAKARKLFQGARGIKPLWMRVPPRAVVRDMQSGSRQVGDATERWMQGALSVKEVRV